MEDGERLGGRKRGGNEGVLFRLVYPVVARVVVRGGRRRRDGGQRGVKGLGGEEVGDGVRGGLGGAGLSPDALASVLSALTGCRWWEGRGVGEERDGRSGIARRERSGGEGG